MKKIFTIILVATMSLAAMAQQRGGHNGNPPAGENPWEQIRSEKIAYITSFVGLTADEAQAFWPVYNEIESRQMELNKKEWESYFALDKAVKEGKGNMSALLDAYVAAKQANVNLLVANTGELLKVLSPEKVAKLLLSEESFRRRQINRLKDGGPHGKKNAPSRE